MNDIKNFKNELIKAISGDVNSMNYIGACYLTGEDSDGTKLDKNFETAYVFLSEAEKKGSAKAKYNLGLMYKNGFYVEKSNDNFLLHMIPLAKKNDLDAITEITNHYKKIRNENIDVLNSPEIFSWFKKAATHIKSNNNHKYDLACMYLNGLGVKKSEEKFQELIKPLIEDNHYNSIKTQLSYYIKNEKKFKNAGEKIFSLIKKLACHLESTSNDWYHYSVGLLYGPKNLTNYSEGIVFFEKAVKDMLPAPNSQNSAM